MLHDKIEKYLDGELEGTELKAFEDQLKSDPALAAKLRLHQNIPEAIMEKDVVALEATMKSIFEESATEKTAPGAKVFSIRRLLAIAASVLVLIVAGWWFSNQVNSNTPDKLFAEYVSYPPVISGANGVRSPDDSVAQEITLEKELNEAWQKTNTAFVQGKPTEALSLLESINTKDPEFQLQSQSQYFYALGLVQLQLEQPEAAIDALTKVSSGDYKEMADWYLALAYLKVPNKLSESKKILTEIAESNHPRSKSAQELLNRLN